MRFSNTGYVSVSGCVMQSGHPNTDGLHFDGPANDIKISGCDFSVNDDSIALNCPEGYTGNISRVAVTGCTFNSWSLMRLYTSVDGNSPGKFTIDTVSVDNCSGTLTEDAFVIGLYGGSLPNSVASLDISDCTLTAPTILGVSENFGTITLRNVTFIPSLAHVDWFEPQATRVCGFLRPSPSAGMITYGGASLSFENCVILRNSDVEVAAVVLENNSSINNLAFTGFAVQNAGSFSSLPELLTVESGKVGQLVIGSVDSSNVKAPASTVGFGNLGSVAGSGVLATHWEFPDTVMADNIPYISAGTGLPSIKVNGVVELYVLS
jgi:hypothetical protein